MHATPGSDPEQEEDAATPDAVRGHRRRRQGDAGSRSEREATPKAGRPRREARRSIKLQATLATLFVPSPMLPALPCRTVPGDGYDAETEVDQPQQRSMRRGEPRYAGIDGATSVIYAAQHKRPLLTKRKEAAVPLVPLGSTSKRRLAQQAASAVEEEARVARTVTAVMERMERRIPLSFLLQRRHLAVAERVALRAMCGALSRHYARVRRACLAKWLQRTVTLRVLEQLARQESLTRHAALAHACAIVQRKVQLRLLRVMRVWHQSTLQLQHIEHEANARVLQRSWRRYSLVTKFQRLALEYRTRHRDQVATRIQSLARMFLARSLWRRLVVERQRVDAARSVQNGYRSYLVRRIAWKRRRVLATGDIQRIWRGFRGRQGVRQRRVRCREATRAAVETQWLPAALSRVGTMWKAAHSIQRCFRAHRFRRQVAVCVVAAHRRRRFFPAWKIQQAWRCYRLVLVNATLSDTANCVAAHFEGAARVIQRRFAAYIHWKKDVCAIRLVSVFRCFRAKRDMATQQLQWLQAWAIAYLKRWVSAIQSCNPSSVWMDSLLAWSRRIEDVQSDQSSSLRRLRVRSIFQLIAELRAFQSTFEHSHASQIQCRWRWYRLLVLVETMQRATMLLQRAIPPLLRMYVVRRRRRRVLGRWKRERLLCMRTAFGRWKTEHLFLMHTRDLERADAKVRKAKWFYHLKVRKKMIRGWRAFVQYRRYKASRLAFAGVQYEKRLVRRVWRAWTWEAAPIILSENLLNEQKWVLHAWKVLQQQRIAGLKEKRATAWRDARAKRRVWSAWRADLEVFRAAIEGARRFGDHRRQKRTLSAWSDHVRTMKRVVKFNRLRAQANGIRQWVFHMCLRRQSIEWAIKSDRFSTRRIARAHWVRWRRYIRQRQADRQVLLRMEQHRVIVQQRSAARQWREFTPTLRDNRAIKAMAVDFSAFRVKKRVFSAGFREFWAMTAGARRIAMAIRIQRAFRAKRARQKLFVLRTKIRYQIDTRVSRGADVTSMRGEELMERLRASRVNTRELWVFVLLSLPWQPISPPIRNAFNRTATNWTFLRKQCMGFAIVDATDTVKHAVCVAMNDATDAQEGYYSLTSVLGLHASALPCIAAFWLGSGLGITNVPVVGFTDSGVPVLKRRYERVCGDHRRESLIFSLSQDQPIERGCSVPELMRWIEALADDSRTASATDLQAYTRGFLARRHFKRLRVLHKEQLAQRIREWVAALQKKWLVRKLNRSAMRIQRWQRGVHKRRLFWTRLRHELESYRRAARRVQAQYRRHLFFRRIHDAVQRLRATPLLFPNAPLCEECLGSVFKPDESGITSLDAVDKSKLTLARVACRECRQALCEACATRLHSAGKRATHVLHTIDVSAMNDPVCVMCSGCEVAKSVRACRTCAQGGLRREDEVATGASSCAVVDAILTCRSCFELRHCKLSARKAALSMDRRQRKQWWEADAFRRHQWQFVRNRTDISLPASATAATSQMVVNKYNWMTMESLERVQQERMTAAQSQQERSDQLFAIRVQNEAILRDAFDRYDTDKSGAIDRSELRRMFREELCQPLSETQLDRAMVTMDHSGNGLIEFDELLAWFAEDVLEKTQNADGGADSGASLALLKEALKAKRQMRRYKERLLDALPPSPLEMLADKKRRRDQLKDSEEKPAPAKAKVPGFPTVECLEPSEFGTKRKVFFRFLHDICGVEWVLEDESIIPIADASDVFAKVFVPRWNAGKLTHDFYFDGEAFELDGEQWERRWDSAREQFGFHTRRKRVPAVDHRAHRRKASGQGRSARGTKRGSTSSADATSSDVAAVPAIEEWENVVEWIDPRRRQHLLDAAKEAFALADRDASGYIDAREFRRLLSAELCEPLSSAQARQAFEAIDTDGSGAIDFDEFFQWYATLKSQDVPLTKQEERARALLKTKRRAKKVAQAVVESAETGATSVKHAVSETLLEQQLAREKKAGAPPELLQLMTERHTKPLALKALALNGHDLARARTWLEAKRNEQEQEAAAVATTARELQHRRRETRLRRQKTIAAVRSKIFAKLPISRGKKARQEQTARVLDAVANLDREIRQVERQATLRHAKSLRF